jgi:hypothetical protein
MARSRTWNKVAIRVDSRSSPGFDTRQGPVIPEGYPHSAGWLSNSAAAHRAAAQTAEYCRVPGSPRFPSLRKQAAALGMLEASTTRATREIVNPDYGTLLFKDYKFRTV